MTEGLTGSEAKRRLVLLGENRLRGGSRVLWWKVLVRQFVSPLMLVLLFAFFASVWLSVMIDAVVIGIVLVVNVALNFFQEYRAEKSLEALAKMIVTTAKVKRDGEFVEIGVEQIVPGDIVRLEIGRTVPADGRLVIEDGIYLNEAILTGESVAVRKNLTTAKDVFMGSVVDRGIGEMVVVATGKTTKMGGIAGSVAENGRGLTPLQKELTGISLAMAGVAGAVMIAVVVIGVMGGVKMAVLVPMAIALAVAAVPEGLVVSLTFILSMGMARILKKKALVRRLVSVETLGNVDVICLDKTGTITKGIMEAIGGEVEGGEKEMKLLMKGAILCNDMRDPLEIAMNDWASKKMKIVGNERVSELPFDPKYKYIVTRHKTTKSEVYLEFLSGAPEVMLLHSKPSEKWQKRFGELGSEGKRLVGFAYKIVKTNNEQIKREDVKNYHFLGIVVFTDPIKEGMSELFTKAGKAGITFKVITGDYKETAWAVIRQAGLVNGEYDESRVMSGEELVKLDKDQLEKAVDGAVLFARTTPDQKLRIVHALQSIGHRVAMTGDGVNDAPALKQADIGIVVEGASDVARETADMVLLTDHFGVVLSAIEEGRAIRIGLKRVLFYMLCGAFAEVFLVGAALIIGWPMPLLATQILWINLITCSFPYFVLTIERVDKNLLDHKQNKENKILDKPMIGAMMIISVAAGLIGLLIFWVIFYYFGRDEVSARTVVFTMLSMASLFYVFPARVFGGLPRRVRWLGSGRLWLAIGAGIVLQLGVIYVGGLAQLFQVRGLGVGDWLLVLVGVAVLMCVMEIVVHKMKNVVK